MISGEISIFFPSPPFIFITVQPSLPAAAARLPEAKAELLLIFKMFHKQYWTFFLLFFILILENGSVRYS